MATSIFRSASSECVWTAEIVSAYADRKGERVRGREREFEIERESYYE